LPQARLPQIQLTDGQRREGTGLLLIIVAALITLSIVFSPGAGLTRVRGFLLDSVGLGWLAVVMIMAAGGVGMIGGRHAAVEGETVRASRRNRCRDRCRARGPSTISPFDIVARRNKPRSTPITSS
jgi:hypothetical protein